MIGERRFSSIYGRGAVQKRKRKQHEAMRRQQRKEERERQHKRMCVPDCNFTCVEEGSYLLRKRIIDHAPTVCG